MFQHRGILLCCREYAESSFVDATHLIYIYIYIAAGNKRSFDLNNKKSLGEWSLINNLAVRGLSD